MKKFIIKLYWIMLSIALISFVITMFLAPHTIAVERVSGVGIIHSLTVVAITSILPMMAILFLGKYVFLKIFIGSISHKN